MTEWHYYGDADCSAVGCPADPDQRWFGWLAVKSVDDGGPVGDPFAESYTYAAGHYLATRRLGAFTWRSEDTDRDSSGLVSVARDAAGVPTAFEYDLLGRVTRVARGHPGAAEAPITIGYPDMLTAIVKQTGASDPNNAVQARYYYDQFFRLTKEERWLEAGGVAAKIYGYDLPGRKTFESEWGTGEAGTHFDYAYPTTGGSLYPDPLGRVHKVTTADGGVSVYDYRGLSTYVTVRGLGADPNHVDPNHPFDSTTAYSRDVLGRLVSVQPSSKADPITGRLASYAADAEYLYDVRDNLVEVRLFNTETPESPSQRRFFAYDNLGRLVSSTNPENGTEVNESFNAAGDVLRRRDPAGNVSDYTYDGARRLLRVTVTPRGGTPLTTAELVYDTYLGAALGASAGKMVKAVTRLSPTDIFQQTLRYEGLAGRLSKIETIFPGIPEPLSSTLTYNEMGLPSSLAYPSGESIPGGDTTLSFTYSRDFLKKVALADGQPLIKDIAYNDAGGLKRMVTGGSVITQVVPDIRNRPHSITVGLDPNVTLAPDEPGDPPDPNGSPGGGGPCQQHNCPPPREYFARLAPFLHNQARLIGQSGAGSDVLCSEDPNSPSPDPNAYYASGTYRYDPHGNIVCMGRERFSYDGSGRLLEAVQLHDGEFRTSAYDYDPFGNIRSVGFTVSSAALLESATTSTAFDVESASNRLLARTLTPPGPEAATIHSALAYDVSVRPSQVEPPTSHCRAVGVSRAVAPAPVVAGAHGGPREHGSRGRHQSARVDGQARARRDRKGRVPVKRWTATSAASATDLGRSRVRLQAPATDAGEALPAAPDSTRSPAWGARR